MFMRGFLGGMNLIMADEMEEFEVCEPVILMM